MLKCFKYIKQLNFAIILLGGIVCSITVSGQNVGKIDSLKTLLSTSQDTVRFSILSQLFRLTNKTDYTVALDYATASYRLALSLRDSARIVEGGRMMAYSLDDLGKRNEAISILNKVIGIALRNQEKYPELKTKIKFLYNNAAIAYMYQGKYDSSLSYHFKSLERRELEEDRKSVGTAKNNIGLLYFKLSNYERALDYYLQSFDIKNELNDKTDLDKILINIGLCYIELGKSNEAIESFSRALSYCGANCAESILKEANYGLGRSNYTLGQYDKARNYYQISLEISIRQNDAQYWLHDLIGLGLIERSNRDYNKSLEYLTEANALANRANNVQSLLEVYQESFETFNLIEDFKNASFFQAKYIKLKDSIYSGNLLKNLSRIQTNYEQRENIKTIKLSNENLKLKDEQLQRQRLQYFFIVLVSILIILLAMVLLWANRRQHVHNSALSEAKRVIEEQNKQLTITNEELDKRVQEKTQDLFDSNETLQNVNEELDNFVYRTSHDIRGPLVTIKGVCNVAILDVKDQLAQDYLRRLNITADKLNSILTRLLIVNQINHTEIEPTEVVLSEIVADTLAIARKKGIPPKMVIEQFIDPTIGLTSDWRLIRIVLENLIDNAIKFYNTSDRVIPFVRIRIKHSKLGRVQIIIEDNGIGINTRDRDLIFHLFVRASDRSENGGIGLYLARLASQRLGGEVRLISSSENGSIFMVLLPPDITPILEKRKELEILRLKEKERRKKDAKRNQDDSEWKIA